MAFRALLLSGAAALALLLACEEDETRPPVTGAGSGVGGGSATNEGGAPLGDSGVPAECSTATITTRVVDQQSVNANAPTASGGTITDGTYDLELDQIYVGAGGLGTPSGISAASTIVITGTRFERVERRIDAAGVSTPSTQSGTLQLAGTNGVIGFTCPLTVTETFSFTAGGDAGTDDTLTLLRTATNEGRTYRRRL